MNRYELRQAVAQLVSVLGMVAGMYVADSGIRHITRAIEAIGGTYYMEAPAERIDLALLAVIGGGMVAGFFMATTIAIFISIYKDADDNRPRRPLRNR